MKKILFLVMLFSLINVCAYAQLYIEPVVGYAIDLNNSSPRFKQFNTGIQFAWQAKTKHEALLRIQRGWPISSSSSDSSFTANPALPVYSAANTTIRPASLSLAAGLRLNVAEINSTDVFYVIFYAGVVYQKIAVSHQYDKSNYTLLNPDITQQRTNAFVSGGIEYMHILKKGRLFFLVTVETPPVGKKIKYPSSFRFVAPLSLNVGYSIALSNK